jgi:hypothetical protein
MHTYISYHFDEAQGGMMNIFLLFLTTLFMIGYYVIYSPSQTVTNTDSENVVKMSDLRSIAECVIGMQNAKMNDEPYTAPCVERYNVVGEYVCANAGSVQYETSCMGEPDINYIVSHSAPLATTDYGLMLEIIEKYYPDKGTFGIYDNGTLLTAGTNGHIELNNVITGPVTTPRLQNGQLVYVMQYKIPYIYEWPPVDDCASLVDQCESCPWPMQAVIHYGRWMCLEGNIPPITCPAGYEPYDNGCRLIDTCQQLEDLCPEGTIADCDTNSCIEAVELECRDGCYAIVDTVDSELNETTDSSHCFCPNQSSDDTNVEKCVTDGLCCGFNKVYTKSQIGSIGRTLRTGRAGCSYCEKPGGSRYNPTTEQFEIICIPDTTKMFLRRCSTVSSAQQCKGDKQAMYFGFKPTSNTDCLPAGDERDFYTNIVFEKIQTYYPSENQDGKWHCLDCPYGVSFDESFPPYVAKCKPEP